MALRDLSTSEILYMFVGWLTTRDEVITFSARHDAAPAAEAVNAFCERHSLPEPREGWSQIADMVREG